MLTFRLRVDGADPVDFESDRGEYAVVVAEAFGVLKMPFPCTVQIWVEDLLPDYGPYEYRVDYFAGTGAPGVYALYK